MVNELIQAKILELFSEKAYDFDQLLEAIDLSRKLTLLKKWGTISKSEVRKISKISEVRNAFAHLWSEKEVMYGSDNTGKPISISDNIEKFRQDAQEVWETLISKYMVEEEKHAGRVIQKLEDRNTIDAWTDISKEREESVDDSDRFFPSIS